MKQLIASCNNPIVRFMLKNKLKMKIYFYVSAKFKSKNYIAKYKTEK